MTDERKPDPVKRAWGQPCVPSDAGIGDTWVKTDETDPVTGMHPTFTFDGLAWTRDAPPVRTGYPLVGTIGEGGEVAMADPLLIRARAAGMTLRAAAEAQSARLTHAVTYRGSPYPGTEMRDQTADAIAELATIVECLVAEIRRRG